MSTPDYSRLETINVTPSWQAVLPSLLAVLQSATNAEARKIATGELRRMADLADKYCSLVEAGTITP